MRGSLLAAVGAGVAFFAAALWWATSGGDDAPRPTAPAVVAPDAAIAPADAAVSGDLFGGDAGAGLGTIGPGRYGTITDHEDGTAYGVGITHHSRAIPSLRLGQPVVDGNLDQRAVRRTLNRMGPRLTYCYEKELVASPGLAGTLELRLVIAPDDTVTSATGTGLDAAVIACVTDVVHVLQFPHSTGAGTVEIALTFQPTGG